MRNALGYQTHWEPWSRWEIWSSTHSLSWSYQTLTFRSSARLSRTTAARLLWLQNRNIPIGQSISTSSIISFGNMFTTRKRIPKDGCSLRSATLTWWMLTTWPKGWSEQSSKQTDTELKDGDKTKVRPSIHIYIFTYFQKGLQVISNSNVKRRVEIMRLTGLNGLNRRLQLRNPKVQYYMSWFTAHEIGLRSNLWLSILFIHSHFVETNRRFTRHSFICYMLILNNINSIWTTDVYLPDKRCVNLIYMLI